MANQKDHSIEKTYLVNQFEVNDLWLDRPYQQDHLQLVFGKTFYPHKNGIDKKSRTDTLSKKVGISYFMVQINMTNNTIQKTTSKGQITLPKVWRGQFKTSHFAVNWNKTSLIIKPVNLEEMVEETVIFSADRDNKGQGIPAPKLIQILKRIDG